MKEALLLIFLEICRSRIPRIRLISSSTDDVSSLRQENRCRTKNLHYLWALLAVKPKPSLSQTDTNHLAGFRRLLSAKQTQWHTDR